MSTIYNNFTITQVSFTETEGNDLGNGVIYTLIIEPDQGYSLNVNNFALIAPYPAGIDSSSATFTQDGAQINLTIQFLAGTIMPGNDLDAPLCIQGFADAAGFSISGAVNINTLEATPLPQFVTYSNTGGFNETEVVFTETITANTNYYFFTEPVMGVTTGNAANYAITNSKVYNIDGQLTSITFNVSYTYPNADVSGDLLQIDATAIPIIVATQYVNAYNINQSAIPAGGDTRVLSLIGDPNAVFSVNLTEVGTGNTTVLANNVTMPATGTYSISGITFPAETSNADPYTIVISGNINPTIANDPPLAPVDVLLDFEQLSQITFTVQATATAPISIGTPSWEFIAVPYYTYVPGQPNTLDFTFKASSPTGRLVVISTVDADSFSPVIPDPSYPDTLYSIGNIVQGLDASGDFTVSGTITIQTTRDVSIINILDLDQIVQTTSELALCYSLTEDGLCCGTPEGRTVFVQGSVTNLADVTGLLYKTSDLLVEADPGYYSDDSGISCSTPPVGTNMRVSECQGGVNWTMENTNGNIFGEVIQYQQGVPGSGNIWCGTVQEVDLSTTPDATVFGYTPRECGDTAHCHE